uniref:phosphatidylserine decarboxylase n=1 Tax=Eimeria falciformis TaxID=84963 RepID=A0A221S610_9EIME|nr:phosphatidylserine decarboxylase 2 [Eimeria falciformis]
MKLFCSILLLATLQGIATASTNNKLDEAEVFDCNGNATIVFFYKSPEKLCVRWSPDTTIGSLSKALMKLGGAGYPVLLRKRGLLAKLAFWRRNNLSLETLLSSLGKASLEAIVVKGRKPNPLVTIFLYLLPRVGVANLPLLDLQSFKQYNDISEIQALLAGSPSASPSWLQRQDGQSVLLFQPSTAILSKLFPSRPFRHVEFRDPELGVLKNFPANMFAFPMKISSYYCSAKIPMKISIKGKEQLQEAFSILKEGDADASILATRRARNPNEKDPQLTLIQFVMGEGTQAMMREIAIDTESQQAPVVQPETQGRYGSRFFRNFLGDSKRLLSRIAGALARLRMSRCFMWKYAALTNVDLEEALSFKHTQNRGQQGFRTLQEFFTRPINYELIRPIDQNAVLVSPADSVIQNAFFIKPDEEGNIVNARIPQVKGTTFNLPEFLFGRGTNKYIKLQNPNNRLHVQMFYLAPADYHRFHSAADWLATSHVYIPGCNPSIRRTVLQNRNLLDAFERTSVQGHWDPGNNGGDRLFFSMTMVAAEMVGGIDLFYRTQTDSNKFQLNPICATFRKSLQYEYENPVPLCMGQEMGSFKFGSTVVVIFEAPGNLEVKTPVCEKVDVNSTVGHIPGSPRRTLPRCDFTYGNYGSTAQYLKYLQDLKRAEREKQMHGLQSFTTQAISHPLIQGDNETNEATDDASIATPNDTPRDQLSVEERDEGLPTSAAMPSASSVIPGLQQQDLKPRGTEEGGPPKSVFVTGVPPRHRATTKHDAGELRNFSTLMDLESKLQVLEVGFFHIYRLALWFSKEWRHYENKGYAMLQLGQLGKVQTDSSVEGSPLCYYSKNPTSRLVQVLFPGKVSSLLLVWPDKRQDESLLRYPNFACASAKGWGKVSRGITAEWMLLEGSLKVKFSLRTVEPQNVLENAFMKMDFTFIGNPRTSPDAPFTFNRPPQLSENQLTEVSEMPELDLGILSFDLEKPQL